MLGSPFSPLHSPSPPSPAISHVGPRVYAPAAMSRKGISLLVRNLSYKTR